MDYIMSKCKSCGTEFVPKRKNNVYCSKSCRNKASKSKSQSHLSDAPPQEVIEIPPPHYPVQPQYNPPPIRHQSATNPPPIRHQAYRGSLDAQFQRTVGGFVGGSLADGYNSARRSESIFELLAIVGGAIGGYMFCESKKTTDKLMTAGFGAMLGTLMSHAFKLIKNNQEEEKYLTTSPQQFGVQDYYATNNNVIVNAQYLSSLNVPSVNFAGSWFGKFIGEKVNYNFSILLSGSPGGGKSHMATVMAKTFERYGKVMLVLSEEGITSHVQERLSKYQLSNTLLLSARNPQTIINEIRRNNIKFVVIDSVQGVTSDLNEQLAFLRALRGLNLIGNVSVLQVSKNGDARGKMEIQHETDVTIEVNEGIARTIKNRFGESGKEINIFPKRVSA